MSLAETRGFDRALRWESDADRASTIFGPLGVSQRREGGEGFGFREIDLRMRPCIIVICISLI